MLEGGQTTTRSINRHTETVVRALPPAPASDVDLKLSHVPNDELQVTFDVPAATDPREWLEYKPSARRR
jgi:hypothetical protein